MRNTSRPGCSFRAGGPDGCVVPVSCGRLFVKLAGKNEPCRLAKLLVARNQQTHEDCTSAGHRRLRSNLPKPTQGRGALRDTFPGQPASVRDAPGSIPGGAAKITSCFLSLSFAPAYALPTDLGDGKKTRE